MGRTKVSLARTVTQVGLAVHWHLLVPFDKLYFEVLLHPGTVLGPGDLRIPSNMLSSLELSP